MATIEECATTEARPREIQDITSTLNARVETAREISQRLQDMRQRLIGDKDTEAGKMGADVPEPVRSEIEEVKHGLESLRIILEETLNDLSTLERI